MVISARTRAALLYRGRDRRLAAAGVRTTLTFTREGGRRLDAAALAAAGPARHVFVCGPTAFVEHATRVLLEVGHDAARVRAERFGGAT